MELFIIWLWQFRAVAIWRVFGREPIKYSCLEEMFHHHSLQVLRFSLTLKKVYFTFLIKKLSKKSSFYVQIYLTFSAFSSLSSHLKYCFRTIFVPWPRSTVSTSDEAAEAAASKAAASELALALLLLDLALKARLSLFLRMEERISVSVWKMEFDFFKCIFRENKAKFTFL